MAFLAIFYMVYRQKPTLLGKLAALVAVMAAYGLTVTATRQARQQFDMHCSVILVQFAYARIIDN